ncbi:MAG: hypothetical protein NZL96_01285 [Patescibacteria group bacterium]|nr:hypothetical protein [Patescibacteria group bacterium]
MIKFFKSPYFILSVICLASTLILWLVVGMETIYRNFDGILYTIPAKTFYNPQEIEKVNTNFGFGELGIPARYYPAHLPLYPLLIRVIGEIFNLIGGWFSRFSFLKSMLIVNLIFTISLTCFLYFLLKNFKLSAKPLLLVITFLFLPRFFVVRSVGAPESMFIFLILVSLYFFEQKRYFLAGLFGGLSTMTKTPGILLFGVYLLVFLERMISKKKIEIKREWWGIGLIPLALLLVFVFYFLRTGDFFAYFNSGDNIHLVHPFAVFDYKKNWVGTAWLEDVLFYFFLYGLVVYSLRKIKFRSFFYFSLIFFLAILFVQHRDISRYSLPLWPMAVIAFEGFFTSREFLLVFLFLLLAIFLYAVNFASYNLIPLTQWQPFL